MMTNEERREAARRLRELAGRTDGMTDGQFVDELAYAIEIGGSCDFDSVLVNRLADLIEPEPERTCRNVCDGREVRVLRMQWHLLDRERAMGEWAHVREPRYCPNCGARAIGDEE